LRAKSVKFSENFNLYSLSFQLSRTTSPATSFSGYQQQQMFLGTTIEERAI